LLLFSSHGELKLPYSIDETLKSSDLPSDLKPHLLFREVLLGAEKRKIFMQLVEETDELVGNVGTKISVPYVSAGFTSGSITADNLDNTGYSATSMAISDIDVSIGNIIYAATKIADVLKEDQPKYDWVRIAVRKMGEAVAETREGDVRDCIIAGVGSTFSSASAGTLAYADVTKAVNKYLKANSWYPEAQNPPILVLHPDQEDDLVNSTLFTDTARYSDAETPFTGETGRFASCRVLSTDMMTPALALVVMPPNVSYGPTTVFAWKRKTLLKTEEEVTYGRSLYVVSERYGVSVVQSAGIVLISNC
jgi:N4-gp56 family major capsid protein